MTSYLFIQIHALPPVCTCIHHSFLALGIGTLFLIFVVFVDIAAGIWVLSEEKRRQCMLFNTGICMRLCACSAFNTVSLVPGILVLEKEWVPRMSLALQASSLALFYKTSCN